MTRRKKRSRLFKHSYQSERHVVLGVFNARNEQELVVRQKWVHDRNQNFQCHLVYPLCPHDRISSSLYKRFILLLHKVMLVWGLNTSCRSLRTELDTNNRTALFLAGASRDYELLPCRRLRQAMKQPTIISIAISGRPSA